VRQLLRHRGFRLLFVGLALSMFGDSAMLLLLGIWVKDLTGSNAAAGATFLLLGAPALVSPLGGYVVDKVRRRPFLIWANLGSAAVVLPLIAVTGREHVWIIYAVAVGYGASLVLIGAAMNGLLKAMLPDDLLVAANAALQTIREGFRLIGPITGAGLYAAFGGAAVAVFDAATFLAAAGCLLALRLAEPRPEPAEHHWTREMAAGARYLFAMPVLRRVVLGCAVSSLVLGFSESFIFAVVEEGLGRPASFVGVLISVQGIGAVVGGVTAAWLVRRVGEQVAVGLGLLFFGLGYLPMILGNLPVALAGVVVAGVGLPWVLVGLYTLVQRGTPWQLMGRVSAAVDVLIGTPQVLSIGVGALLLAFVDYRLLIVTSAIVMTACTLYLVVRRPPLSGTTGEVPAPVVPVTEHLGTTVLPVPRGQTVDEIGRQ